MLCKNNFEKGHFTTISPDKYVYSCSKVQHSNMNMMALNIVKEHARMHEVGKRCPHDYILLVRQQHEASIELLVAKHQEALRNATRHSAACKDCTRHAGPRLPYDIDCGKIRMPNWFDTSNHHALCNSQSRHGPSNRAVLMSIENRMFE